MNDFKEAGSQQNQEYPTQYQIKDKYSIIQSKWKEKYEQINFNGFTKFPSKYQSSTLLGHFTLLGEYFFLVINLPQLHSKIVTSLVMLIIETLVIYFWFSVSKANPTDDIQKQFFHDLKHNNFTPLKKYSLSEKKDLYCNICQIKCLKNSFHCRSCNRCVHLFDHHCKWVNNCIAASNYFQFIGMLISLLLQLVLIIGTNIYITVTTEIEQMKIIAIITLSLSIVIFVMIGALLGFHFHLICKNKSTFNYLLALKNKEINQIKGSQNNRNKNLQENEVSNGESEKIILAFIHPKLIKKPKQIPYFQKNYVKNSFVQQSPKHQVLSDYTISKNLRSKSTR